MLPSSRIGVSVLPWCVMHILLIEDEAPDMAMHRRVVEDAIVGATIREASTLRTAEEALANESFDLVVLDLNLHGDRVAGLQLVEIIRDRGDAAIIVISGMDVDTYRPMMYRSKIWDYFEKPIDPASFRLVLERIVDQRCEIDQELALPVPAIPGLHWPDALSDLLWHGHLVNGLTLRERQVLRPLLLSPNKTVRYADLYDASPDWDRDPERLKRALITMMNSIRNRFRSVDPSFDCIFASAKQGYMWRV